MVDIMYRDETYAPFRAPVSLTTFPHYAIKVTAPMDLGTIRANVVARRYVDILDLDHDMRLILAACEAFNGYDSNLTKRARQLVRRTDAFFWERKTELKRLQICVQEELRAVVARVGALGAAAATAASTDTTAAAVADGGGAPPTSGVAAVGDGGGREDLRGGNHAAPPPRVVTEAAAAVPLVTSEALFGEDDDDSDEIVLEEGV